MATKQQDSELDEIEGIGVEEDASWGDYPLDTPMIRNETRTVQDVLRRINENRLLWILIFNGSSFGMKQNKAN